MLVELGLLHFCPPEGQEDGRATIWGQVRRECWETFFIAGTTIILIDCSSVFDYIAIHDNWRWGQVPMAHSGKIALIDGYNVIMRNDRWRAVFSRNQDQGRAALLAYCAEWKVRRGDIFDFMVVFDGGSSSTRDALPHIPHVRAIFTRGTESADDRIIRMLRDKEYGSNHVVVSDDREVAGKARSLGAEVVSVAGFCGKLRNAPAKQDNPEDDKKLLSAKDKKAINDELRELFGIE